MYINPKEIMFGLPVLKVRHIVRLAMQEKLWSYSKAEMYKKVAIELNKSRLVAKEVVTNLILENYLIFDKEKYLKEYFYRLKATEKGTRFGMGKAIPPISRQKATQLLKELIDRAKQINANKELVYFVEGIVVFGSYLTCKEVLGDLDVGFKIAPRYHDEKFNKQSKERIDLVLARGRTFSSIVDKICWPADEIKQMLKARKRSISLHNMDIDEVFKMTEYKQVYYYKEN